MEDEESVCSSIFPGCGSCSDSEEDNEDDGYPVKTVKNLIVKKKPVESEDEYVQSENELDDFL